MNIFFALALLLITAQLKSQQSLIFEDSWSKNDSIKKVVVSNELPKNKREITEVFIKGEHDTLKYFGPKNWKEIYIFKSYSSFESYLFSPENTNFQTSMEYLKDSLGRCIELNDTSEDSGTSNKETFEYFDNSVIQISYTNFLGQIKPSIKTIYEYCNELLVKTTSYDFIYHSNLWNKRYEEYYMYDSSGLVKRLNMISNSGESFSSVFNYTFRVKK